MMSPMPFCPSLDPWKKLTPVQVSTSNARMGHGGGVLSLGASYSAGYLMMALDASISNAAQPNPRRGEISSTLKTLVAWLPVHAGGRRRAQFMSWLASRRR